jgi:[acyl-carrier-protein] S-malonyltransferase
MSSSKTGTAMVFPGMGPLDFAEVGKFMIVSDLAREFLGQADDALGYSVFDALRSTESDYSEAAQAAFLVNCLALARWAEAELGVAPDICTGGSFGERAAAVYGGALSFPDAVKLTAGLVSCISEYFQEHNKDVVTQSFARAPRENLGPILQELDEQGEWYEYSCYLDDDIFMISLRERNLEWFQQKLRGIGAFPMYVMRPPLHSTIFGDLRALAEERVLGGAKLTDPSIPIVSDQDGTVITTAEGVRNLLLDGFVRAVRWPDTMDALRRSGVKTLCIAGPDRLFGRVNCVLSNFDVIVASPRTALQPSKKLAQIPEESSGNVQC